MAQHKHLFVMDPVENLNMKLDSSLRLAKALLEKGQECYITTPTELTWSHTELSTKPTCEARQLVLGDGPTPNIVGNLTAALTDFQSIHMRKDPPFDMEYISSTWLLAAAERAGVTVYNQTDALRGFNEKLAIFEFPQHCEPGIVSSQSSELFNFMQEHADGDVIIKPLTLFGGRGVRRLQLNELGEETALRELQTETNNNKQFRLIQPFNKAIFEGELRVFACCGEVLSWCLKKPAEGEYLANTRKGATLHSYTPSSKELAMVQDISQKLAQKGVKMVGYDIIGGKISEINITSPRLLLPESIDTSPYYTEMASYLLRDLEA